MSDRPSLEYFKGKPNTATYELEIIADGLVVEGYTLRYLRQIRDLLLDIREEVKQSE